MSEGIDVKTILSALSFYSYPYQK